ncbi:hypothetical protein B0H16DRAFT_1703966 [Mycena metata]|uniref:Uncharacterized protein n=1 Tax=Mycena metata TaxID=1033252 RepID=A0AAD7GZU5_9AGAR|nr:hypothetical protein B0H16DRAFT_1703966 [Mycena metata]
MGDILNRGLLQVKGVSLSTPSLRSRPISQIFPPIVLPRCIISFLISSPGLTGYNTPLTPINIQSHTMLCRQTFVNVRALWLSYAVADPSRWRARRCESNRSLPSPVHHLAALCLLQLCSPLPCRPAPASPTDKLLEAEYLRPSVRYFLPSLPRPGLIYFRRAPNAAPPLSPPCAQSECSNPRSRPRAAERAPRGTVQYSAVVPYVV